MPEQSVGCAVRTQRLLPKPVPLAQQPRQQILIYDNLTLGYRFLPFVRFEQSRVPILRDRSIAVANLVPQQFTAVYGHNLQRDPAMGKNVPQKFVASHWVEGRMKPGEEIDPGRTSS
jgi:hypothetical protein